MSFYRDTATAIAQRAPGNFIGVVLYVPVGGQSTAPWWRADALVNSASLEEWYEGIANSPPLYYYIAAFDKTRGAAPVGEAIAPPKPGTPGFDLHFTDRWRHPPFKRTTVSGTYEGDAFAEYLRRTPGLVSHGVVLQNLEAPREQQVWAYEVRWLRGQPVPSLPTTIDDRAVKLVIVDAYPRPQATISGESGRGAADIAKIIALFAAFAIPVGLIISKTQERKQLREEKATFHRLGFDWNLRSRH